MKNLAPALASAPSMSTPEQSALAVLLHQHENPRAFVPALVIAAHWDSTTNQALVSIDTMARASGRSRASSSRYKSRADGNDQRDNQRSKLWEEVKFTQEGTIYRLNGRGLQLWAENKGRLLKELQDCRMVTGLPLLEDRVLGSEVSQEDMDFAYGITDAIVEFWEDLIDRYGYEAAAGAAGVTGGAIEMLFSYSLRYGAATDHSMMAYVASEMGKDGISVPDLRELTHYAGIKNERFVLVKARKVAQRTGFWVKDDGSFHYSARGLALRAAWSRLQGFEVSVTA